MAIGSDFKLKYQIVADAAKAKAEIRDVDDLLRRLGGTAGGAFGAIGAPAAIAGTAVLAIGAAAVSTGTALFNLTKQASDFGSEIFDASKKTGLHAEALSAMKFAAEQSGSSMEQVTNGVAKFAKAVGAAADSTKKGEKFLHDFGFTPQEALKDLDGALDKVFKRIMAAPEGFQRMSLAQKAFGKSGADLLPFLDSFDGDLKSLIKKAKELGVTIDDETARSADEFGDQLDTLSAQFASAGRTIGMVFMKDFMKMAEATSEWAVRNKDEMKKWAEDVRPAVLSVADAVKGLGIVIGDVATFAKNNPIAVKVAVSLLAAPIAGIGTLLADIGRGGTVARDAPTNRPDIENDPRNPFYKAATPQKPGEFWGWAYRSGKRPGGADEDLATGGKSKAGRKSTADDRSDKQVYQDFIRALKQETGVIISGLKGFRTEAQQAALYRKLGPGEAARPGTSSHEFYGGVDLPAGISQAALERAARKAGVILDKPKFHQGTGWHRHQDFRKGKATGGGEEEVERYRADRLEEERETAAGLKEISADLLRDEEEASERRLDIRRAEAEITVSIIEDQVDRGIISERQGVEEIGQIKFDLLRQEQDELLAMVPTEERLHQIHLLDIALTKQAVDNENARNKILRERLSLYASLAVEGRSGDEQIADILAAQAEAKRKAAEGAMVTAPGSFGGSLADSLGADLVPMWDEVTNAMIGFQERLAMVQSDINDFVGNAIGGMVDGLIQMGVAWLVTGEGSAKAAMQMMAATALSIAVQSGIKAIFEAAESVAAYARYDVYAGSMHAAAATLYGTVAMIAGTVGVGLALGARAMGGGSGGGRGSQENVEPGFGSRYGGSQNPDPFSRTTGNPFQSGQNTQMEGLTRAVQGLEQKISSMPAKDVVTIGIGQNRGLVTNTVIKEARAGRSADIGKALGL